MGVEGKVITAFIGIACIIRDLHANRVGIIPVLINVALILPSCHAPRFFSLTFGYKVFYFGRIGIGCDRQVTIVGFIIPCCTTIINKGDGGCRRLGVQHSRIGILMCNTVVVIFQNNGSRDCVSLMKTGLGQINFVLTVFFNFCFESIRMTMFIFEYYGSSRSQIKTFKIKPYFPSIVCISIVDVVFVESDRCGCIFIYIGIVSCRVAGIIVCGDVDMAFYQSGWQTFLKD